jgi:hypothetical protein
MFLKFLLKIAEIGARRTCIVSTVCIINVKGVNILSMQYFMYSKTIIFPSYEPCPCENKNGNNAFSSAIPEYSIFIVSYRKAIGSLGIPICDAPRQ